VFLEVTWNPDAGELRPRQVLVEVPHPDPEIDGQTTDAPCACDEDGEPYRRDPADEKDVALDGGKPYDLDREPDVEPIGEIDCRVVEPLCVRYNPEATSEDDAEEMFVAYLWPKAKVADEFDVDIDELLAASPEDAEDGGRADFDNVMSSVTAAPPDPFSTQQQAFGTSQETAIGDRVLVIKYYAKPCDDYPEGRHWINANAVKVWPKPKDTEYPNGEAPLPNQFWPPLIPIIDTPVPGQPHGVSLLSQVVPLNEQLNYLDGKIGEYHVMMAMGGVIWVAPEDKNIEITSEPGQVKVSKGYGTSNRPPIREQLHALPEAVYGERGVLETKIRIVAGISDADLSQRPEGVTSGRGILALQEASDAPLMPLLTSIENALEEVGRRMLVLAQEKYSDERTIKIRGDKGRWEFRSFKGADLCDGLDVRVQTGSTFPWSKAAQWDSKISLLTALPQLVINAKTGQVDKEALGRYLDSGIPGFGVFETDEDPDLVEVEREHAMFEAYDPSNAAGANQLPQLAVWQNNAKHLEAHFTFMKRDFARFLRWSDAAKAAFLDHMRLTAEAVDQLAAQAAGVPTGAGAPPGAEGAPGAPGAPPEPGAGPSLQLVPPGGTTGQLNVPTSRPPSGGTAAPRLTRTDYAAAGSQ